MIFARIVSHTLSASLLAKSSWSKRPGAICSLYINTVLFSPRPRQPELTVYRTMASRRSARLSAQAEVLSMPPPPAPATKPRKRKASSQAPAPVPSAVDGSEPSAAAPSTPKRRGRKTITTTTPPPATPTPSAVGLIAEPAAANTPVASQASTPASAAVTTPKPKSRAVARLADPKGTNATLLSPESSRIVSRKPAEETSTAHSSEPKITTANILTEACAHLIRTEPRLKPMLVNSHALSLLVRGRSIKHQSCRDIMTPSMWEALLTGYRTSNHQTPHLPL